MNIYKFHTNPESLDFYEEVLTKDPKLALDYARFIGEKFTDGEKAISKDAESAYYYAKLVIKGRFPEGEAAIAKHAGASLEYAYYLKKRFPMGESEIAKDAYYAYHYAVDVIKKRFPDGEETIAKHGMYRYDYNKRFKVKL
jgi:hypothetical protein